MPGVEHQHPKAQPQAEQQQPEHADQQQVDPDQRAAHRPVVGPVHRHQGEEPLRAGRVDRRQLPVPDPLPLGSVGHQVHQLGVVRRVIERVASGGHQAPLPDVPEDVVGEAGLRAQQRQPDQRRPGDDGQQQPAGPTGRRGPPEDRHQQQREAGGVEGQPGRHRVGQGPEPGRGEGEGDQDRGRAVEQQVPRHPR